MATPLATHTHQPGGVEQTLEFLKRTRYELRELRKVRIWKDRLHVIDVNKDLFEVTGLGYLDEEIVPVLLAVNAVFDPHKVSESTDAEYKEFNTGRRYPWAHDRIL